MNTIFAIAAGGAVGAVMRHFVNSGAGHIFGTGFPYGILIANVLGSFLMGCLIAWFALVYDPPQAIKAFFTVGLLGAFTTFSTFSMDAALLIERGAFASAGIYIGASVMLAIGGLFAGMALIRMFVT